MSIDEDLSKIANNDQLEAAWRAIARIVGGFYLDLLTQGIDPDHAAELTMPIVEVFVEKLRGDQ